MSLTRLVVLGDYIASQDVSNQHSTSSAGAAPWIDNLCKLFGFQLLTYAKDQKQSSESFPQQVQAFLSSNQKHQSPLDNDLILICHGTEEALNSATTLHETVLEEIKAQIDLLRKSGVYSFIVCTPFSLIRTPYGYTNLSTDRLARLSHYHAMLAHGLRTHVHQMQDLGTKIACLDFYALFADVMAWPERFGIETNDGQELEWKHTLFEGVDRPRPTERSQRIMFGKAAEVFRTQFKGKEERQESNVLSASRL